MWSIFRRILKITYLLLLHLQRVQRHKPLLVVVLVILRLEGLSKWLFLES